MKRIFLDEEQTLSVQGTNVAFNYIVYRKDEALAKTLELLEKRLQEGAQETFRQWENQFRTGDAITQIREAVRADVETSFHGKIEQLERRLIEVDALDRRLIEVEKRLEKPTGTGSKRKARR